MPRLFTALEVPEALAVELSMIRGGLGGARWIDKGDYHLTLRFVGDVDERAAQDLHSVLEGVRRPRINVTLSDVGAFGGDKPRALVMGAKLSPELADLQAQHERLCRRIGLPPETRKFAPHVTLARLRQTPARAVADFLAMRGGPFGRSFAVERFVLFSARDSVGGGPYVPEAVYPLQ